MTPGLTAKERADKLAHLYRLRHKIDNEISDYEDQIRAETETLRRIKEDSALTGTRFTRRGRAECGTDGGYYRHRRTLQEPACSACKLAHRLAERDRTQRRNNSLQEAS